MDFKELWPVVIEALEKTIPYYDKVNDYISFGQGKRARVYAVQCSDIRSNLSILDAGIGPGSLSELLLSFFRPRMIVGLDFSTKMLKAAIENLSPLEANRIQIVRGILERLPFQDRAFDRVFSSFTLRDAMDLSTAIREFHRVCKENGMLIIIDIGKPNNKIIRAFMTFYMHVIMPIIAKILIIGKIPGNPWRLIIPTYENLLINESLKNDVEKAFSRASLKKFMFGGIIVIQAKKSL